MAHKETLKTENEEQHWTTTQDKTWPEHKAFRTALLQRADQLVVIEIPESSSPAICRGD